jgi:hypothetical protein
MISSHQKSTGTSYTTTVALIAAAVLSPTVLAMSRPVETSAISLAFGISGVCLILAWINWRRASHLSIPSLTDQKPVGK